MDHILHYIYINNKNNKTIYIIRQQYQASRKSCDCNFHKKKN